MRPLRASVWILVLAAGLSVAWAAGTAGHVDATYGTGGVAAAGDATFVDAVALADGSVVALGQDFTTSPATMIVRKFTPSGAVDTAFGPSGDGVAAVFGASVNEQVRDLAVGPDGRIFVAGYRTYVVPGRGKKTTTIRTGSIVALTSAGLVDSQFGDGGYVDNSRGVIYWVQAVGDASSYDLVFSYTMPVEHSSGDGGNKGKKGGGSTTTYTRAIAMRRVDSSGQDVTSFGTNGELVDDLDVTLDEYATNMEADELGRLLVVVNQYDPDDGSEPMERLLSRYDADGDLDTSFGTSGRVSIKSLGAFSDLAIDADGRDVIVCAHNAASGDPEIVRYSESGVAGTTFDVPSLADTTNGNEIETWTKNVLVDASGRVSVCLWYGITNWDFAIVRCLADGSRDTSFGPNGDGVSEILDESDRDVPGAMFMDGSGRLGIAGQAQHVHAGQTDGILVRWLGN